MTHPPHDIIIFGEGGDWLKTNRQTLQARFSNPQFVGEEGWRAKAEKSSAPLALVMTPPHTHKEICLTLAKNNNIQKIYCEKPFPDISEIDDPDFQHKIRVIDHYLLKSTDVKVTDYNIPFGTNKVWRLAQRYLGRWHFRPGSYNFILSNSHAKGWQYITHSLVYIWTFLFRFITFFAGWTPVKYIEIDIKEKLDEERPWMKQEDMFGGVVYDLSHHALAIVLRLFGVNELNKVVGKDINIQKVRHFDNKDDSALCEISFLIKLHHCTVRINVAKSAINTSKKIALYRKFMTHAMPNREYDLKQSALSKQDKGYDYAENFDDGASCLTYDEVCSINQICERVKKLAKHKKDKKADVNLEDMGLINNLTDQFKHRHGFYWQYYYKLVIYQVIILLTPYAFALNFAKKDTMQAGPAITIFALTACISLWIYYWGVQKVTAVLSEEHIRMKVVHDRLKELLNRTKIDLSVISINDSSISDVMLTQYRFLIRGFCLINPVVIYFMFQEQIAALF